MKKSGQIKIQQMAFVLVALMIFFGFVALIYFSFSLSTLREDVENLRDKEARETVKQIANTPELAFTSTDCSDCVDLDKALILSERQTYNGFWNLDFLSIEKLYPDLEGFCERGNYPNCREIVIVGDNKNTGAVFSAFVPLCRWESGEEGYFKCELGRIKASGVNLND